ncbi:hypothetical protein HQ585_19470 [candidate division KSB1 bacterium]|nr:hypothetical protein [candidate division KSB1 bacterium]
MIQNNMVKKVFVIRHDNCGYRSGLNYFMVLPWHFRDNIVKKENKYIETGGGFAGN